MSGAAFGDRGRGDGDAAKEVGRWLAVQDTALGSDIGDARFVSHRQIARSAGLGRKATIALRRMVDNFGTRGVFWASAPGDYIRRRGTS